MHFEIITLLPNIKKKSIYHKKKCHPKAPALSLHLLELKCTNWYKSPVLPQLMSLRQLQRIHLSKSLKVYWGGFSPSRSSVLTAPSCWLEQATCREEPDWSVWWSTSAPCWTRLSMHSEWPRQSYQSHHNETWCTWKVFFEICSHSDSPGKNV